MEESIDDDPPAEVLSELDNEKERMLSSLSFFVIVLLVGFPLWWKTTQVEQSYIPHSRILALNSTKIYIGTEIVIIRNEYNPACNLKELLLEKFQNSRLYVINIREEYFSGSTVAAENIENDKIYGSDDSLGKIFLRELPVSDTTNTTIMTTRAARTIYYTPFSDKRAIIEEIDLIYNEEYLINSMNSKLSPDVVENDADQLRRIRPSLAYDIVLTVVVPEPQTVTVNATISQTFEKTFGNELKKLNLISEFRIKSQWLYLVDFEQIPRKKPDNTFELRWEQIPLIITPLENKLGSGLARNPSIQFVTYVSKCEHSPTYFTDKDGKKSLAVLSARWGGIQLVNPKKSHCEGTATLRLDEKLISLAYFHQFRGLLGLQPDAFTAETIHPWELDYLYRLKALEYYTSAVMTLSSLSHLLNEISNIVITEEVGMAVRRATYQGETAAQFLKDGRLQEALIASRNAYASAEFAFSHPSLLALLYFPSDQKYAIYIPLFLPVTIPILFSLKRLCQWVKRASVFSFFNCEHEHVD